MQAQAQLIATSRAVSAAQLVSLGPKREAARDRIAALTDAEVLALADRVDSLPAGASGVGIGMILVLIFLVWRFGVSDQAEAAKPAPEQKK